MLSSFSLLDLSSVHQEQIPATTDDLSMGQRRFAIFRIPDRINHPVEGCYHMIQIEDDLHMRDVKGHCQDVRVPHVHSHSFNIAFLFFAHHLKELMKRFEGTSLGHPDDPSRFVIQDDGHILMPFLDGNLVDGKDSQTVEVGSTILFLQEGLVDLLDGLPIESQMLGDFCYGHRLAELEDISSQAFGDSLIGIETFQILDTNFLTRGTDDLPVAAVEIDCGLPQVQIPDGSLFPIVDRNTLTGALVTDRTKSFVGTHVYETDIDSRKDLLTDNFHSLVGQIRCYTCVAHRETPFCMVLMRKHNIRKGFSFFVYSLESSFTH